MKLMNKINQETTLYYSGNKRNIAGSLPTRNITSPYNSNRINKRSNIEFVQNADCGVCDLSNPFSPSVHTSGEKWRLWERKRAFLSAVFSVKTKREKLYNSIRISTLMAR